MNRFEQARLGRCDFLDVLEESVLMHAEVRIELADGTSFQDRLIDVATKDGQDVARFRDRGGIAVAAIAALEREPLAHTYPT